MQVTKLLLFTYHYPARCFGMNMPKSRDIQAKIPLPQAIWNFGYITVNGVNSNLEIFSKGQEWGIALYFVGFYCMISSDRISRYCSFRSQ